MIERATKAVIADLHRQALRSGCHTDDNGRRAQVDGSFEVEPLVRAVLLACRNPSTAMVDAAFKPEVEFRTTMGNLDRGHCGDADFLWQTMVDTALEESSAPDAQSPAEPET